MHFPCVRIQENFEDKADLIRIGHAEDPRQQHLVRRLPRPGRRLPHRRAAPEGAGRRSTALATIKAFIEAWMDYGERRAIAAIRELPAGTCTYEVRHDPVPGVADEGMPITAKVTIDPEAGLITVDVRDNPDCVPGGLERVRGLRRRFLPHRRLSTTSIRRCPHNHGSASRIVPLLRDDCVVGRPQHPIGTSCATSNVNERLANAVQCCFAADRRALWHGRRRRQLLGGAGRRLRHRHAAQGAGALRHPAHARPVRRTGHLRP